MFRLIFFAILILNSFASPILKNFKSDGSGIRCRNRSIRKRFVAYERKWEFSDLTWKFVDPFQLFSSSEDFKLVHLILTQAMHEWENATEGNLRLLDLTDFNSNEFKNLKPDIEIFFALGDHGDYEAFDGLGGIVAHTGYPMSGAVHFDAAEPWTIGKKTGVNLPYTALHELGHALGLRHSENFDSIMNPIYKKNLRGEISKLSADDVNGIQNLFPKRISKLQYFTRLLNRKLDSNFNSILKRKKA